MARHPRSGYAADPIAAVCSYDYADAFELQLEAPGRCSLEEWVRGGGCHAGLDQADRRPRGRPRLGSARIVESDADVVLQEDSNALMDTVMVGRYVEPERRALTTVLRSRRPLLARAVWAFRQDPPPADGAAGRGRRASAGDRSGDAVLERS